MMLIAVTGGPRTTWPCGFVCPSCGHPGGWRLGDGRFMCAGCGSRTSVMAGTIFDRTRTPLTVWFSACWHFASGKDGISALSLKRTLEIGSYQTAWAMLHRLRSVLVLLSLLAAAAVSLLPAWTRWPLRLPLLPVSERLAVRPAGSAVTGLIRWALTPVA